MFQTLYRLCFLFTVRIIYFPINVGGSYIEGAGSEPLYWGNDFVTNNNVVLVTINYRVGALGFMVQIFTWIVTHSRLLKNWLLKILIQQDSMEF